MLSVQAERLALLEARAVLAAAPLLILAHILLRVARLELRNPQQARLAALAQHLRAAKAAIQLALSPAPLARMAARVAALLDPTAMAARAGPPGIACPSAKAAVAATAVDQPVRQAQAVLGEQAETTSLAPAAAQSPAALAALAAAAAAAAGLAGLALSASTSLA